MKPSSKRWEYEVFRLAVHSGGRLENYSEHQTELFREELAMRGEKGWELVGVEPISSGWLFFMKRPC